MDRTMLLHHAAIAAFTLAVPTYCIGLVFRKRNLSPILSVVFVLGMALNFAALVSRAHDVRHAPLQTRYEAWLVTCLCIALGYILVYVTSRLYRSGAFTALVANGLGVITSGMIALFLFRTATTDSYKDALPPALQSAWFWPHVTVYLFGYGTLFVAFCSSVLYLLMRAAGRTETPEPGEGRSHIGDLDIFTYRVIAVGFPFLSMGLIFGAMWAHDAWATYWGWDSKEVWSLITWTVYLIYLHLRLTKGWRGTRSAVFVVVGVVAIIITFEFFGFLPASQTSVHKY